MGFVWLVLSALVIAAGVRARMRQRSALGAPPPKVDDAAVRAIEQGGAIRVDRDEPLDLDEIGKEEERFWSETWNEPSDDLEEL
jgi:hypothetical protein